MSRCTLNTAMARIESATIASQIAVFDIGSGEKVEAVFADTVVTQALLERHKFSNLIGIFSNFYDNQNARVKISEALAKNRAKRDQTGVRITSTDEVVRRRAKSVDPVLTVPAFGAITPMME